MHCWGANGSGQLGVGSVAALGDQPGELPAPAVNLGRPAVAIATGAKREISAQHPIDWEGHYSQDLPQWNATWGVDAIGGYRERFFRLSEIETKKFSTWVVVYGEYKPRPDIAIRVEAAGVTWRNSRRIREVYIGPRNLGRLDFTDERSLEYGGSFNLRVRKTLG